MLEFIIAAYVLFVLIVWVCLLITGEKRTLKNILIFFIQALIIVPTGVSTVVCTVGEYVGEVGTTLLQALEDSLDL